MRTEGGRVGGSKGGNAGRALSDTLMFLKADSRRRVSLTAHAVVVRRLSSLRILEMSQAHAPSHQAGTGAISCYWWGRRGVPGRGRVQ